MTLTHAPHAHAPVTVSRVMLTVMAALVPATLFGFWLYGWPAVFLWATACLSALLAEALAVRLQGRPVQPALLDGSGLLTAWLLALSLPPWAPWWIAVIGAVFAVVIVKQVFGGLGQNVFNPAMAARVMLLISFPVELTTWIGPSAHLPGFIDALGVTFGHVHLDAVASASLLGHVKTEFTRGVDLSQSLAGFWSLGDMAWGHRAGSLGETSAPLLLLGGLVLIWRRIIGWQAPLAMMLGVAVPAVIAHAIAPNQFGSLAYHLLSGGLMLGAFFIATDPVTSPNTALGMALFGAGCGLLTWLIRSFGGYPEGVAFAVMLMNTLTPVIDRYVKPRIYGRDRKGRSMAMGEGA